MACGRVGLLPGQKLEELGEVSRAQLESPRWDTTKYLPSDNAVGRPISLSRCRRYLVGQPWVSSHLDGHVIAGPSYLTYMYTYFNRVSTSNDINSTISNHRTVTIHKSAMNHMRFLWCCEALKETV